MADTNQDAEASPAPSSLDDILERAVGAVRTAVIDRETGIYEPDAIVDPPEDKIPSLGGGQEEADSADAMLPPPKKIPSAVERYGHASPDPADVFPIATGSPRKREHEESVLMRLAAAAEAAGPGQPVSLPEPPAVGPDILGARLSPAGDGPIPGSEPPPRRPATGPVVRGPRIVLEPEEELPGPTRIPTGPIVIGPRMSLWDEAEDDGRDAPPSGPDVSGPRMPMGEEEGPAVPERPVSGPDVSGPRMIMGEEEGPAVPERPVSGPDVSGPRMIMGEEEGPAVPERPVSGPDVSGPRMIMGEEEAPELPDLPPSGPTVSGPRMATDGRDVSAGPEAPPSGPTIRGPRMTASGDRPAGDDEVEPPPGDPTVRGGGRLSVSPDRPTPPRASNPTMEGAVSFPPPAPAWARKMKRPAPAPAAPVEGLQVVRPRTVEVLGEAGPAQKGFARLDGGRDKVRRRLDFQHQRFELVRVRRPLFAPKGGDPEPAAWPAYLSEGAPIGNGLLAQVIAARFSDHDSTDAWARMMVRLGVGASGPRLSEAVVAASTHVAPVWQALHDAVLAKADGIDEGDLAARVPDGRQVREGRVRGVTAGAQIWFSWRDGEDLSPVLPRGSKAEAAGHRAFDLLEDSTGRSRSGRWAKVRQRLHALLPQDPERAAYGLHLAHRVRRTMTATPDPELLGAAAAGFRRWLDARRKEFDAPRSPLERVVVGALAEWPDLAPVDEAGNLAPALHTLRTGRQSPTMVIDPREGPPEDILAWHSLVESCHRLGQRPWDYLHELLHAAAHGRLGKPAEWTPARWAARARG